MLGVVLVDELRQPQSASHARGAAADDDDVGLHLRAIDAFERFAENEHLANLATDSRRLTRIKDLQN